MRTRFLNTDYFSSSPVDTLSFLNLPVPHLAPPPPPEQELHRLLRFFHPLETLSLPIERPPIDSALSKFISSVLPHFIDFDFRDFLPDRFHQVYFQNILFILVFFLCLISVDYDALSLIYLITFKFVDLFSKLEPLYLRSFFLVLFLFFSLNIFFLLLFFNQYLEKLY